MIRAPRLTRRRFLGGLAATASMGTVLGLRPSAARAAETVADAKFASVVHLGEGAWAVVSKPLTGGFDTGCNGGFCAGKERVVAFDSYAQTGGAEWVLGQIRELTGRQPTDLVLSHHHFDHIGGAAAFAALDQPPQLWITAGIRERLPAEAPDAVKRMVEEAELVEQGGSAEIDLGGMTLRLDSYAGHTPSDLVATLENRVTYYGDLVWNDLFPNFMDAVPGELKRTIATLLGKTTAISVPGHGSMPEREELERFSQVLDAVEERARRSLEAGQSAAEAARGFTLPADLGEWTLFSPNYFETAIAAWHDELSG